jgi:lysophospholipase L1-like esterase
LALTFLGDSKTTTGNTWTSKLVTALRSISNWASVNEAPPRLATSGWTVGNLLNATDAWIAAATQAPDIILINIGVNDTAAGTSQANFESRLGSVLDKLHAAFPAALINVAKVWRADNPAWAVICDSMDDVWMPNVLATRPWAVFGVDERSVIRDPDNGASKTSDLVHYNAAGQDAMAAAQQQIIEGTL